MANIRFVGKSGTARVLYADLIGNQKQKNSRDECADDSNDELDQRVALFEIERRGPGNVVQCLRIVYGNREVRLEGIPFDRPVQCDDDGGFADLIFRYAFVVVIDTESGFVDLY